MTKCEIKLVQACQHITIDDKGIAEFIIDWGGGGNAIVWSYVQFKEGEEKATCKIPTVELMKEAIKNSVPTLQPATTSTAGVVKIGNNINVDSDGTISVKFPDIPENVLTQSDLQKAEGETGSFKVPTKQYVDDAISKVEPSTTDATKTSKGVVQIGDGINVNSGVISLDKTGLLTTDDLIPIYEEGDTYKILTEAATMEMINKKSNFYNFDTWSALFEINSETGKTNFEELPAGSVVNISEGYSADGTNHSSYLMKYKDDDVLTLTTAKEASDHIWTRFSGDKFSSDSAWRQIPVADENNKIANSFIDEETWAKKSDISSVSDATKSSKGVVQIGDGINVASGVITLDKSGLITTDDRVQTDPSDAEKATKIPSVAYMQDYVANHSSGGGGDTSNCLKHEDLYPTYKTGDSYKVPTKAYVDEQLDTKANITETKEIREYLNPFKDKWVAILTDDYYDCPNFTNNYDYTSESSTSGLGVSQFWWYKLIKKLGARKCKVLVYPTIQYDNTMSSEMWNAMLDESTRSDASLKMFNGQTYYDIDENYTQKIYEGDRWPDIVICALGNNSYWYDTTSKPDADRWGLITRYFNQQIGDLSGSTIIFLPLTSRYSLKSSSWVAPDPTYKASVQGYLPSNLDVPLENIVFDSNDITNITKGDDQYCLFNESGNEKIANMIYEKMIASCLNLGAQFGDVITTTYRAQADPTSTVDKERQVPSVAYMQKYVADHASGGGSTTNCLVKTDLYPTYTQGSSYLVPTKAYLEEYVQANAGGDTSKCLMKADLIPSYIEGASYKVPTQAYVDDKINAKTDIYTFSTWTEMLTIPELTEEQIAAGETALSPYDKVPANSAIVIAEGPEEGVNSFLMKGSNNTCLCFAQSKTDEGFIYTRFLNGADITIENLGDWQKIPFAGEYLTRDIITTAPVGDPIEKATLLSENATLFAINTAMPALDKKSGEDENKITVPTSAKVAATYSTQGHTHWGMPTDTSKFKEKIKEIVLGSKVSQVFDKICLGIGAVAGATSAIDTGWLIALQSQVSSLYSIVAAQGMVQGTEAASATANTLSGFSSSFSNTSSALSTLAEADADISEATDAITAAINDGTIDLGGSTIENISNSITSLVNTPVATRSLSASKSSSSLPPKLDNPLEFLNYIKIQ